MVGVSDELFSGVEDAAPSSSAASGDTESPTNSTPSYVDLLAFVGLTPAKVYAGGVGFGVTSFAWVLTSLSVTVFPSLQPVAFAAWSVVATLAFATFANGTLGDVRYVPREPYYYLVWAAASSFIAAVILIPLAVALDAGVFA